MYVLEIPIDGRPSYIVSVAKPEGPFAGGLPKEAVVGQLIEGTELRPDNFAENPLFQGIMHAVIAARGSECEGLLAAAAAQQNGPVYVSDRRAGKFEGDVAKEDIIGAFEVSDGLIIIDSYMPNPEHSLMSDKGFFVLDRCLYDKLMEELGKLAGR